MDVKKMLTKGNITNDYLGLESFFRYLVSENFMEKPKSWVVVG